MNLTMTTPSPALPVIPTADFPAQIDRDRLQAAMANSRVSSTRRCYASQWKLWSAWARDRDLEEIPAAPAAAANFLVDRADAGTSIATVPDGPSCARSHTPGLRAHRPTDNEGVRRVMSRLSRTIAKPQNQAAALTRDVQMAIQATAAFPRCNTRDGYEWRRRGDFS